MYYKLIGCKVLEREISSVVYNCRNVIDVTLLRQKLHNTPSKLKDALQERKLHNSHIVIVMLQSQGRLYLGFFY